jgi:hypothetical protein
MRLLEILALAPVVRQLLDTALLQAIVAPYCPNTARGSLSQKPDSASADHLWFQLHSDKVTFDF